MEKSIKNALDTYPLSMVESQDNCGRINKSLYLAVKQDTDIEVRFVLGEVQGQFEGRTEPHYFVYVPSGQIDDKNHIIDGAVDQFVGDMFSEDSLSGEHMYGDIVFGCYGDTPFNYSIAKVVER